MQEEFALRALWPTKCVGCKRGESQEGKKKTMPRIEAPHKAERETESEEKTQSWGIDAGELGMGIKESLNEGRRESSLTSGIGST